MATNIKYLKENNLYEAHKHFMRLSEVVLPQMQLPEDEQDDNQDMGGQDPMGGGQDNGGMNGQDPIGGGQDPMGGGDQGGMGDPMGGGDQGDGGMPSQGGMDDPMGGDGQDPMGGDDDMMGGDDPMGGDDDMESPFGGGEEDPIGGDDPIGGEDDGDTIDIDDLTNIEDKIYAKQNHVGRDLEKFDYRINNLIDTVSNLMAKIDDNNAKIENLKTEFEKRNPTQTEKLKMRSMNSYPYNVPLDGYWEEKAKEGNYEIDTDNSTPTAQEYQITRDDIDDFNRNIADTFDIDDELVQTLDKLL